MNTQAKKFVVVITYSVGQGVKHCEKKSFADKLSAHKHIILNVRDNYIQFAFKGKGKYRSHKKDTFKDSWRIQLLQNILLAEEDESWGVDYLLKVFHEGMSEHRTIEIIEEA